MQGRRGCLDCKTFSTLACSAGVAGKESKAAGDPRRRGSEESPIEEPERAVGERPQCNHRIRKPAGTDGLPCSSSCVPLRANETMVKKIGGTKGKEGQQ